MLIEDDENIGNQRYIDKQKRTPLLQLNSGALAKFCIQMHRIEELSALSGRKGAKKVIFGDKAYVSTCSNTRFSTASRLPVCGDRPTED